MQQKLWKLVVCVVIPVSILLLPAPPGLTPMAWNLVALYVGTILGIILRPLPEPAILIIVIAISGLAFKNTSIMLAGYANSTAWLVLTAFLIGTAIVETGLGRRVAYNLIGKLGKSTLALGYVAAFTDFALSPVMPSNTARGGGIVFPIVRSLAISLGSTPGPTSRRVGAYLTILLYQVGMTTGYLFLTAIAPNVLSLKFGQDILKIELDWLTWALAAAVPGMICLLLSPLVVYWIYPPELKTFDNKKLSRQGLEELGPMSRREKILSVLFVLAIVGWGTGSLTKIDATTVAIAFVAGCLAFRVITWDNLVATKGAWTTFAWYGGIIGIGDALVKAKFFDWLANLIATNADFTGFNPITILAVMLLGSLVLRYLFASMAAFVATMVPVFFTIVMVAKVPVYPAFFLLVFATTYGCMVTHYSGALGPALFGDGYVDQKTWWKIGALFAFMNYVVHLLIGLPYWKFLGFW